MGNVIAPEELKTELVVMNDNELNMSELGNLKSTKHSFKRKWTRLRVSN